jgi:hypothetical protein
MKLEYIIGSLLAAFAGFSLVWAVMLVTDYGKRSEWIFVKGILLAFCVIAGMIIPVVVARAIK